MNNENIKCGAMYLCEELTLASSVPNGVDTYYSFLGVKVEPGEVVVVIKPFVRNIVIFLAGGKVANLNVAKFNKHFSIIEGQ